MRAELMEDCFNDVRSSCLGSIDQCLLERLGIGQHTLFAAIEFEQDMPPQGIEIDGAAVLHLMSGR